MKVSPCAGEDVFILVAMQIMNSAPISGRLSSPG